MVDALDKMLGEPEGVHLANSKVLTASDGPVSHPDERMSWRLRHMDSAAMRPAGWQRTRLLGEVGKPRDEPWSP